jgi:hypothetical protein
MIESHLFHGPTFPDTPFINDVVTLPLTSQVRQYEMEAASDYRLNYRLFKACKGEVDRLCPGSCKSEEGQVSG